VKKVGLYEVRTYIERHGITKIHGPVVHTRRRWQLQASLMHTCSVYLPGISCSRSARTRKKGECRCAESHAVTCEDPCGGAVQRHAKTMSYLFGILDGVQGDSWGRN
jgi:hypothetical protein